MLKTVTDLRSMSLRALDGEIGNISDLLFDDLAWNVRYLVIDTGSWLSGRQVLISPESLRQPSVDDRKLPVQLTRLQIENSPTIQADASLDQRREEELRHYYSWQPYWAAMRPDLNARELAAAGAVRKPPRVRPNAGDPHLRSARATSGYEIAASDGDVGSLADFVVDTEVWAIRFAVVETGSWLTNRKVLLGAEWIRALDWADRKAQVPLKRASLQESPPFDPDQPIEQLFERNRGPSYGSPQNFA